MKMRKLSVLLGLLAAANSVFAQGGSVGISGGPGMHINSQTTSYAPTAAQAAADCGNAVQMNGSSLTYTLVSPPPSSTCPVWAYNLNATALTISRNGLTINGGTSNITLNQYSGTWIWTDATNYFSGPLPLVAGANITLTPAANGLTIAASGGSSGLVTILTKTANYTTASGDFSAATTAPTEVIYAVTTATTVTHTLPSTVTTSGAYQIVKNSCTSTFGLYVAPANALTLDGDTTNMFLPPCNQITITSDGTNWRSSLWENRAANIGTYLPFNALDRFGFNSPSGANVSQVYTFQLEKPIKVAKINFLYTVGAAASNGDYGIYDQGGNLVTHTGSQSTAVGTNQFIQAAASPVVTLAPGVYTIAMCDSSVTPTFAQATISGFVNNMAFTGTSVFGMGQGATACSAGVLPATLGAVTYNNTQAGAVLMVVTP